MTGRQFPLCLLAAAFLLFLHFGSIVECVSITSIKVPPAVENGSAPVVLDCEYSLAADEKQGLVVQWFLRDHPVPVYQWIPGKRPQDNGPLKGRLNLEHRASEDPYHRHRALEIVRPSTELGGEYRCKVATFDNEDTAQASMIVFVPAETFEIEKTKPMISTVNVTCRVEGIFPEPHLELFQEDGPHGSRMGVKGSTVTVSPREDGRFDAILYRVLEDRNLPADTIFECLLSLPETEYQIIKKMSYQPGAVISGSALPTPDNNLDPHEWIGGTSVPTSSISAPHRSTADPQQVEDDDDDEPNGVGRGIRAHDVITDNGGNLHSHHPWIPGLLLITAMVAKYLG